MGTSRNDPVVPAIALVELLAQTGGLAVAREANQSPKSLRLAALTDFKFPASAGPGARLDATADVVGRRGPPIRYLRHGHRRRTAGRLRESHVGRRVQAGHTLDVSPEMPPPPGRWATAVRRARLEGNTPLRQALAIGLGLYIGASPFIGLHLALAIGLGWLFGLNRVKVYAAAQISNQRWHLSLYAIEAQVGSWPRNGHFLTLDRIDDLRLNGLAADILLGSVVVGLGLAAIGTTLTYWGSSGRRTYPFESSLVAAAADRYLTAGVAAWELPRQTAHGSGLPADPPRWRLPSRGVLLDLGCGQGYMLALLAEGTGVVAARTVARVVATGRPWISNCMASKHGRRWLERARKVLDVAATISELDLTTSQLPHCDAILLVDVLHLLSRDAQDCPAGGRVDSSAKRAAS